MKLRSVFITGGAGYVGSVLIPQLLDEGWQVTCLDTFWFGDYLPRHAGLKIIRDDIRGVMTGGYWNMDECDALIHLANISNDPSFDLNADLSTTINYDTFEPLVVTARECGVKRFINCSSSSVYGLSDNPEVKEDHPLVPMTLYNKFKGLCEPLLFKHQTDDFTCVNIRPATVCGYSPGQRLDLAVNILTNHAMNSDKILVTGGSQKRPNLHIQDMCDVYKLMLEAPHEKIQGETFNVGGPNHTILELAKIVQTEVMFEAGREVPIEITPTNDQRSYWINSDKIRDVLGFVPKKSVQDAIGDLIRAFRRGLLPNAMTDTRYSNVKRLIELGVK